MPAKISYKLVWKMLKDADVCFCTLIRFIAETVSCPICHLASSVCALHLFSLSSPVLFLHKQDSWYVVRACLPAFLVAVPLKPSLKSHQHALQCCCLFLYTPPHHPAFLLFPSVHRSPSLLILTQTGRCWPETDSILMTAGC